MTRALFAAAALLLVLAAPGRPAGAQMPETVNWTIAPDESADRGSVEFTISYRTATMRSTWSSTTRLSELEGLDAARLTGDGGPVRFRIVREAGRFDCDGTLRRRHGSGDCRFEGDAAFAAALAGRGIGRAGREDLYQLALARVGIGLVEELGRQDFARPSVGDLIQAGIHGADAAYVRAMSGAGYRGGTVAGLVQMRIHGVTPDLVRSLAEAGYRPDADTAVALRIHGATPAYVAAMRRASGRRFDADELVAMRIHGVTPELVGELAGLGYRDLSASQLTAMRIHGVTGDFVRRALDRAPSRPSPEQLLSLRIAGRY